MKWTYVSAAFLFSCGFLQQACSAPAVAAAASSSESEAGRLDGSWAVAIQSSRGDGTHRAILILEQNERTLRGQWTPVARPEFVNEVEGTVDTEGKVAFKIVSKSGITMHVRAALEEGVLRGVLKASLSDPGLGLTAERTTAPAPGPNPKP